MSLTNCEQVTSAQIRHQRWSIFRAMRCRWFVFQQQCDTDYFWKSLTSPLSRLFSLTIRNDYFLIILRILGPIILVLFTICPPISWNNKKTIPATTKNQPWTIKNHENRLEQWNTDLEPWKTDLEQWNTDLEPWKTNLEPWKTIKICYH